MPLTLSNNRFTRALSRVGNFFNSTPSAPASWFVDWLRGGTESDSGLTVNYKTALTYSTIWHAVNVIAGDLGQLPLVLYRRTAEGREPVDDHPSYHLLRHRPNPWMNACTWKEAIQAHVLLAGNGRSGIVRNGRGEPMQLVPFLPDRTREEVKDGQVWHVTQIGDDLKEQWFRDADVLHIKGLGFDGITGYDVISLARNSFGLGLALEKHGNRTFKNAARPSIVLETDGHFSDTAARQILHDWEAMTAGLDNSGRTALLQRGLHANAISVNNDNSQWLQSREFQRQEIAGWFGLPPHKVGDSSKVAYNSLEQENASYLHSTLNRWLNAWQEECYEKLLSEEEKASGEYYVEFNTAALLRADLKTRYAGYQIGITNEFLSPNEVREKENMNKREGGDVFRNPNTKVEKAGDKPAGDKPKKKNAVGKTHLRRMVGIECNRLTAAAGSSQNFLDWMNKFYDRWNQRWLAACDDADASEHARGHCERSQTLLLDICGQVQPHQLPAAVAQLCNTWTDRIDDTYFKDISLV